MIKKQGITLTVMTITIIILAILAGTITFSTYSTINYSRLSAWANEITYIQDVVDEETAKSSAVEFTSDVITLYITDLTDEQIAEQFQGETISDNRTVSLVALDLNKLNITNTHYGNLKTDNDIYAISEKTGRVYYVQGIEAESKIYYSLTNALKNRFDITKTANSLTSVVFVPSVIGYSNEPIKVTVKLPNTYTDIVVTTSNDEIQIGAQSVKEKTYEYTVNENLISGNYTITVLYNDGTQTLTSKYNVNGYDVTPPVIQELTYDNFVYKQTDATVLDYLVNIKATDESGIKVMKYALGVINEQEAVEYFKENGNPVINGRINLDRSVTKYTIYAEDNAGNFSIFTFDRVDYIKWVIATVDEVPIPRGFVASNATGENTREGGLVIYEGTKPVTDANVDEARRTRNQYVWVPVASEDFTSKFIRKNFGLNDTTGAKVVISNVAGTNQWEIELADNNMPLVEQSTMSYISQTTLAEVQAMYSSVKAYEGFYIARYEAGIDTQRTSNTTLVTGIKVHSKMNKIPYTFVPWGTSSSDDTNGAVEVARGLYPSSNTNYGVVSTLTYGVQWDSTLQWWLDTNAVTSVTASTTYGNYNDNMITSADDLNVGAQVAVYDTSTLDLGDYVAKDSTTLTYPKAVGTSWALSTGGLKIATVKNIYDMAGNVMEWTMEGSSTNYRARCGGYFNIGGASTGYPVGIRSNGSPSGAYLGIGFRPALYIKI